VAGVDLDRPAGLVGDRPKRETVAIDPYQILRRIAA
jgi:hypothetical protein